MKQQVMFTFSSELVAEPIIYNLGMQFRLVTNISRAELREDWGWAIMDLEGEDEDIKEGISWVISKGVRVDPIGGDTVES